MARQPYFLRISLVACAINLMALPGCSDGSTGEAPITPAPLGDPLTWDVKEPGLYTCGHRVLSTTYTPPSLPSRTIEVHVWYPSTAQGEVHTKYHGIFEDTIAYDDLPLAPTSWKAGMPVLVHSHGHMGFAGNSARIMCHFASHGWLAVAPAHLGNLINDTPSKRPLATYIHRPFDIRASLDLVSNLPADDELSGKADLTHVAMSGHSYGTYTTWAIAGAPIDVSSFETRCQAGDLADCTPEQLQALGGDISDARAQIVIPMAGAPTSEFGFANMDTVKVPVLMMSGTLDTSAQPEIFAALTKVDLTWTEFEGGCHQLFGSGNSLLGAPECADLPDEEGFQLVNPWVLGYTRYHVWQDRTEFVKGIVEGTVSSSPKVHYQHKGP